MAQTPTSAELAACKLYMKVDGSAEDTLISSLMASAWSYLKRANIRESNDPLYATVRNAITLHWYDHRDDVDADKAFPLALRAMINQLKNSGDPGGIL